MAGTTTRRVPRRTHRRVTRWTHGCRRWRRFWTISKRCTLQSGSRYGDREVRDGTTSETANGALEGHAADERDHRQAVQQVPHREPGVDACVPRVRPGPYQAAEGQAPSTRVGRARPAGAGLRCEDVRPVGEQGEARGHAPASVEPERAGVVASAARGTAAEAGAEAEGASRD